MLLEEIKKEEFNAGLEQGLQQGLQQGLHQGQVDLASAIQELRAGKTPEDLIKDGISEATVELAKTLK